MIFADLLFVYLFLPINLGLYYLSGNRSYRNAVLTVFSLFFYAWGEPIWVCLLLFSALVDYLHGMIIELHRGTIVAKLAVVSSLIINLGLLGTFKYSSFLVESVNGILGTSFGAPSFALPIGISFYTFQTISYTIDVYRGEVKAQTSFPNFLLFVSLYHQLVAGPIVRYTEIANFIDNRQETWPQFFYGINRFLIGLAKKALFANLAGKLSEPYLHAAPNELTVLGAWYGILLFALQIYYDFSGYSDMAIGLGAMFGFQHPENFRYPYLSRSATEFWRRWHITLGRFFRDYLYIPLGGNRSHSIRNLLLVWFATGLWHGASWNFILWGLYYGFLVLLERRFLQKRLDALPAAVSHLYFIVIVLIGWVFFQFTDLSTAFWYLGRMFGIGVGGFADYPFFLDLMNHIFWIAAALLGCLPLAPLLLVLYRFVPRRTRDILGWFRPMWNLLLLFLSTVMLVGQSYNPFMYFRF